MKHLKKFEESKIKTVNFSEIGDSWSAQDILNKDKDAKFTGKKTFDLNLGQRVKDMLLEYRIGIISVGPGKWLHDQEIVLKSEENLKEFRVELGVVPSFQTFMENNGIDDYENENLSEEELSDYKEKYENEAKPEDPDHNNFKFSVFFPLNVQDKELSALFDATNYLKLLNEIIPNEVKYGNTENDCLANSTKGFKTFINKKGLKITNNNIEDVISTNYRIYKDSKFLCELKEVCEDNHISYRELINDWLELAE